MSSPKPATAAVAIRRAFFVERFIVREWVSALPDQVIVHVQIEYPEPAVALPVQNDPPEDQSDRIPPVLEQPVRSVSQRVDRNRSVRAVRHVFQLSGEHIAETQPEQNAVALLDIQPVSYTHLDVYKRQIRSRPGS